MRSVRQVRTAAAPVEQSYKAADSGEPSHRVYRFFSFGNEALPHVRCGRRTADDIYIVWSFAEYGIRKPCNQANSRVAICGYRLVPASQIFRCRRQTDKTIRLLDGGDASGPALGDGSPMRW